MRSSNRVCGEKTCRWSEPRPAFVSPDRVNLGEPQVNLLLREVHPIQVPMPLKVAA